MDVLNNINVVIGIIVGLITIGTTIYGGIKFLLKKAHSPKQSHPVQPVSTISQPANQVALPLLSRLDWMEVLWGGLEDCFKAKDGGGWFGSIVIGAIGAGIVGMIASSFNIVVTVISFTLYFALFVSVNILFYVYFVGRRIEKKLENINKPIIQKAKNSPRP